jgi:hypothetical protein
VTDGGLRAAPLHFLRQITLNGVTSDVQKRSIVLPSTASTRVDAEPSTCTPSTTPAPRARAWSRRATRSSRRPATRPSRSNCFDGAVVRNVEVTIYDNDQPGVLLDRSSTELVGQPDNTSVVLEGWGTRRTRRRHRSPRVRPYQIVLASAPAATCGSTSRSATVAPDPHRGAA